MRFTISMILSLLFICACAAGIVYNSKGEDLYHEKCGGCHRLYAKSEFDDNKREKIVDEMSIKAKLNPDQKRMIIEYLSSGKN